MYCYASYSVMEHVEVGMAFTLEPSPNIAPVNGSTLREEETDCSKYLNCSSSRRLSNSPVDFELRV